MADDEINNDDLFGTDDEDDDFQPEAQPSPELCASPEVQHSKHDRLQALANQKKAELEAEAGHAHKRKRSERAEEPEEGAGEVVEDAIEFDAPESAADRAFIDDEDEVDEAHAPWAGGDDEDDGFMDQPPAEAEEGDKDPFDVMLEQRKKRRKGVDEMALKEQVDALLSRLDAAATADKDAIKKGKPATAKLKTLPVFEDAVSKPHMHRLLLDGGVLGIFHDWLYPYEDGTLPNIRLRGSLFRMLDKLNVDTSLEHRKDQLQQSGLGHVVMFYSKLDGHNARPKDETDENRRLAASLVQRWAKPIFDKYKKTDHDHEEDVERQEHLRREKRRLAEEAEAKAREDDQRNARPADKGFRWHARVPAAARLDYTKQPEIDANLAAIAQMGGAKKGVTRVEKKLKNLKGGKKGGGRAANVSVEGRGVTL